MFSLLFYFLLLQYQFEILDLVLVEFLQEFLDIIKLYFDNDESGNKATDYLIESVKSKIIDNRIHYKNFNDLNDYLVNVK